MLRKVAHAGTQANSFVAASHDLETMAEAKVSRERVQRWCKRVGEEVLQVAEARVNTYQALTLPEQRQSPTDQVPRVACVMMDGGRLQVRPRVETNTKQTKGYWKESLVGCCLSMTSELYEQDPCPTIPPTFVDPRRMCDLSREIKGFSPLLAEAAADGEQTSQCKQTACGEPLQEERPGCPKVLVRSVVATRKGPGALGPRLIAEAYARGFQAAKRKAFVADGAATNWRLHQKHFSRYTPILDFTHAICYVYTAAMAGRSSAEGWSDYCQWAQWLWAGEVDQVIAAIARRAEPLGLPPPGDKKSPAALVLRGATYLRNQRSRMRYHEYRREGLPITSSHIESIVKQVNRRVKGTEKFWDQGIEPLLHLVADQLSETHRERDFWRQRRQHLPCMRSYHLAA